MDILAIILVSLAAFVLSMLWYSPLLFGKEWMKLAKIRKEDTKNMSPWVMIVAAISILVTVSVLDTLMRMFAITTFFEGLSITLLAMLGLTVPVVLNRVLWRNDPVPLFVLDSLHFLVVWGLAGGAVAVW